MTMQQELNLPVTYGQQMTTEMAQKVEALKSSIDMHNKEKVIAYGCEEQAHIGKFSDSILKGVGTTEVGEAGKLLTEVIGNINGYQADCNKEKKGLFAFLRKQKAKLQSLQTRYRTVAENMDRVVEQLQKKDLALGQVSRNYDIMYEDNLAMYDFLSMVIFAGEQALVEEKQKLAEMQETAKNSTDLKEAEMLSAYSADITRFERRIYDLKLTRTVAIQQAPQIRNIQKSADELSESIKTTIRTSIPLWKNQMAMSLGMQIVREGLNAVNAVKDATNAMLLANSQMNKELTLEAAKAVERGIIDIETISKVNSDLIESLQGSYEIAQKAIASREEGARQLQAKEAELRNAIVSYIDI